MRIAWATPFRRTSAIGRVSADVTAALAARGHDVQLILTEYLEEGETLDEASLHPTLLRWTHIKGLNLYQVAEEVDIVVAQVGDHYGNHAGIFQLFEGRERGVNLPLLGVFHDFYLYNLFQGWLHFSEMAKHSSRLREIEAVYGSGVREADDPDTGLEVLAARTPMTEWIAAKCDGALAHAQFYENRVLNACPGPVGIARLPVTGRGIPPLAPTAPGARLTALTVGVVNPNKAAEVVIAAIAASPMLKERLEYRLTGPVEGERRTALCALATSLGYSGLRVEGPVDDGALAARLEEADIIICLRKPVLEGASGSAIEALLAGRPLLVADNGFYTELPEGIVSKVPAEFEPDELTFALERLCTSEALRRRMGASGRSYAQQTFLLGDYVIALEDLLLQSLQCGPKLAFARSIGKRLSRLSIGPHDRAVPRIAQRIQTAFEFQETLSASLMARQ